MSIIILALDGMSRTEAIRVSHALKDHVAGDKANDLLDEAGAGVLNQLGGHIKMADPKIKDIPNTVANRVKKYDGKATFLTLHGTCSYEALEAAVAAAQECKEPPKLIAVTVTTDFDTDECYSVFGTHDVEWKVLQLVRRAKRAGFDGIVCSPEEVAMVRETWPEAIIIVPGVRSPGADTHDQQRVGTPAKAIADGADYIVCGREIVQAGSDKQKIAAAKRINADTGH